MLVGLATARSLDAPADAGSPPDELATANSEARAISTPRDPDDDHDEEHDDDRDDDQTGSFTERLLAQAGVADRLQCGVPSRRSGG